MAKVGAQRAAVLTGRSKSTIQRAMNSGKLSYEIDQNDRRVIDVSELERVFGIKQQSLSIPAQPAAASAPMAAGITPQAAPSVSVDMAVERENMRMQIKMLEQQLHTAQEHIDDLKDQRDKWEKQASQVLLTSQYSQRQAEELKAQIREREERARQRRAELEQGGMARKMPAPAGGLLTQGDADVKKNSYKQPSQQPGQDIRKLDEQMRGLKADNQNADGEILGSVFRFWKRARG